MKKGGLNDWWKSKLSERLVCSSSICLSVKPDFLFTGTAKCSQSNFLLLSSQQWSTHIPSCPQCADAGAGVWCPGELPTHTQGQSGGEGEFQVCLVVAVITGLLSLLQLFGLLFRALFSENISTFTSEINSYYFGILAFQTYIYMFMQSAQLFPSSVNIKLN